MLQAILTASLLAWLAVASDLSASPSPGDGQLEILQSGTPPCDALAAAGLGDRLLFPADSDYEAQIETWFALNARLRPWCLFLPENAKEVSLALTTLVNAGYGAVDGHGAGDWHIAIKSGGHSVSGNNIANGVTIDLSMMNSSRYDETTNLARVEPGGRWENVYANLEAQGVTAVGGRDGDVGVGGFLLGGGNSFFSGKKGFGCDSVVNYEVVLGNGSIVNANKTANSDLWRALKGGGSNFGIVTRFDLEALATREILYDLRFLAANYSDAVINTVVDFADHDESLGENSLVTFLTHDTSISQDMAVSTIYVNTVGDKNAQTSFNNLKELPALINRTSLETMAEAAAGSKVDGGQRSAESTRTFKNDPAILRYCVKLHAELVESLKRSFGAEHFTSMMFFQPIPSYFGHIAKQRGGNMLGLENLEHNAILWTIGVTVDSGEAALAIVQAEVNAMSAKVRQFSELVKGEMDFIYLNYADASQDPIGSYGPENVQYLRHVAAKYDPTGVFQTRVPGGFKLGDVV